MGSTLDHDRRLAHACFPFCSQSVEAGLEEQRLQRERQETQWVSEAEARAQVLRVKAELKSQERQAVQLESSSRAVDRSLGQSNKKLQVSRGLRPRFKCQTSVKSSHTWFPPKDMHHELELLTKELRQVNLQQFIKQTGTKVTVLPAEPGEDESGNGSQSKGNLSAHVD